MDDISEKISALLNSSEGMERLKSGVMSILGNDNEKASEKPEEQKEEGFSIPENLLNNIGNMQGIMRIANILGNQQQDSRQLYPEFSPLQSRLCTHLFLQFVPLKSYI